jgi:hypothetical protein
MRLSDAVCEPSCAGRGAAKQRAVSKRRLDLNRVKRFGLLYHPIRAFRATELRCAAWEGVGLAVRPPNRTGTPAQLPSPCRHPRASADEGAFRRRLTYVRKKNESPGLLLPAGYPIFSFVYLSSDDLPLFFTRAKIAPPAIKPPKTAKITIGPQISFGYKLSFRRPFDTAARGKVPVFQVFPPGPAPVSSIVQTR